MTRSTVLRLAGAALALALAAGCTPPAATTPAMSTAEDPELAGAWYEVYFETGSFALNPRGDRIVRRVALVVANAGPTEVTVIGRTDRVGAPPENMALARERADAVRDALIAAGVPAATIRTTWTGEALQAVPTADQEAEPLNRVVDIKVVKLQP
jgi:peptidoglycan-associated lipoprotein